MADMRTTMLAIVACLALAGCKKKPTIDELTKLKEQACACTNKECAQKYSDQMEKMFGGVEEKDLDDKMVSIMMDIATCVARQGVRD